MMEMHRSTVGRYETDRAVPNYQTVIRFAEIYKIDKEYLVDGLDKLLPNVEAPGFVLKEKLEGPDISIILQLLQNNPDLKKHLSNSNYSHQNAKPFFTDGIVNFIKLEKNHKDKM